MTCTNGSAAGVFAWSTPFVAQPLLSDATRQSGNVIFHIGSLLGCSCASLSGRRVCLRFCVARFRDLLFRRRGVGFRERRGLPGLRHLCISALALHKPEKNAAGGEHGADDHAEVRSNEAEYHCHGSFTF
ncbi:hypothetical protein [Paraburkholderia sp. RL17-368-BIF-A]|uniref:hypothetical protein n=1 Tax=Paraburkholderia sp. RL17-368-BIF-A TaxID=3031628 RepID=UPI0038CDA36C